MQSKITVITLALLLLLTACDKSHNRNFNEEQKLVPAHEKSLGDLIIGRIGKTTVGLPRKYVYFLEFDNDPSSFSTLNAPSDNHKRSTAIRSFGLDLNYPNLQPIDPNMLGRKKHDPSDDTIHIGVLSNSYSGDINNVEPFVEYILTRKDDNIQYEKSTDFYGLETYIPLIRSHSLKGSVYDVTVYFQRSDAGADTYIECLNFDRAEKPCKLKFIIPDPMRAIITISFDASLLPHWKKIRLGAENTLNRFKK
jgi:hypothetical protein